MHAAAKEPSDLVAVEVEGVPPAEWSYHDLAARVSARGHGVLLGWRRVGAWEKHERHETRRENGRSSAAAGAHEQPKLLNPREKERALRWCADDMLLVLRVSHALSEELEQGKAAQASKRCARGGTRGGLRRVETHMQRIAEQSGGSAGGWS